MSLYSYKAKDSEGKVVEEVTQATDKNEVLALAKANNLQLLSVKNLDSKLSSPLGGKISLSEKANFAKFMGTMLRAGLSMPEALDNIREETNNDKFKKILFDLSFQVRRGATLSSVMSKYSKDFDNFFITIVKAGENSGTVDQSFDYLAKQLALSYELNQKVKGAMMYPIIIIITMLANVVVMMVFVLPKLSDVFLELNMELPFYTRYLLMFGSYVGNNTLTVFVIMIFTSLLSMFILYLGPTRKLIYKILLKISIVSSLIISVDVSRYLRTLSTLLKSGVIITTALDICADVLKHPKLIKVASGLAEGVTQGESISSLLQAQKKRSFPNMVVQTIKIGETSGNLSEVLEETATFYEKEVDYSLKKVTSLIEPLLMLIVGIAVGALVLMMITPIYSLVGGFDSSF